jgi:cation diffusion facilitator family transporter
VSTGGGTRAIITAFLANLAIAAGKLVGFLVTGSSSMLAEAVHSAADTGNQALLMLGTKRAKAAATPEHPFGHGRERYFWAFVVALVLFSLGSLFAIYEGIDKVRHPHEIESLGWAVGILAFAFAMEANAFHTAFREASHIRGPHSWPAFIRRARVPELPVIMLEDLGAMVGLVLAFTALVIAEVTGDPRWDGVGTLGIGVLLGIIAVVLAIEMKSLLIGEGALPEQLEAIRAAFDGSPAVERVIHMRTEYVGPDDLLVAAKVQFRSDLSTAELARAIDETERAVRAADPIVGIIYLEPALYDPTRS